MSDAWALRLLRWSYCAFIAWASAQVFLAGSGAHELHARLLAGAEVAAITAFLIPPLEIGAAAVLMIVYAVASVITLMQGQPPIRFVYYAATALYIVWASRRSAAGKTSLAAA